jgi:hypothetical protein
MGDHSAEEGGSKVTKRRVEGRADWAGLIAGVQVEGEGSRDQLLLVWLAHAWRH